ncbi:MAG: hypothetical protein LBS81_02050 [Endomicrobium sp.]|jgi:hypothetical protein|nr:hypothetical protein [Endomicrobium sp.]
MFLIAPGCGIIQRDIIAQDLSSSSSNRKKIVLFLIFLFPVLNFWSIYQNGIKYIEDILPVLSEIIPKILKNYLSSVDASVLLGLRYTIDVSIFKEFYI